MTLPVALAAIAQDLDATRAEVLRETETLSQAQADWRPSQNDWSVGEILHHLTLAEINTGKLTSKLLKDTGGAVSEYPSDVTAFAPLPPWPSGPREAPPLVRPDKGHPIAQLLQDIRAARARSHQSLERLATVDPRTFTWRHFPPSGGCSPRITTGITCSRSGGSRRLPASPGPEAQRP
jgi:hypothetical protein